MRVLITGAAGQLGRELVRKAPDGVDLLPLSRAMCDVSDADAVEKACVAFHPTLVINSAAYTAVDKAEADPDAAFAVNESGARNVAAACVSSGARMIQISTDYVFDGKSSRPYPVSAVPIPLNVYGRSKLGGERAVQDSGARWTIIRCGWLYSSDPGNFFTNVLNLLRGTAPVRMVDDQVGVPTAASDLAKVIWWCARADPANSLLHWAPAGSASRYQFAVAIRELACESGFLTQAQTLEPVGSEDYPTIARRPAYTVLDATRTWAAMNEAPQHWSASVAATFTELLTQR